MFKVAAVTDEMPEEDQPVLWPAQTLRWRRQAPRQRQPVPYSKIGDRRPATTRQEPMLGSRVYGATAGELHLIDSSPTHSPDCVRASGDQPMLFIE